LNSKAVELCSVNAMALLQKALEHYIKIYLAWICCRCQPVVLQEGEEKTKCKSRRCYNRNCSCFKSQVPCLNCHCNKNCYSTPEMIENRKQEDKREGKEKEKSPKKKEAKTKKESEEGKTTKKGDVEPTKKRKKKRSSTSERCFSSLLSTST